MQNNQNECLKFSDGLTLVFIALKFLDKFPYSWWIVFSPLLILFGIVLFPFFIMFGMRNKKEGWF
jgi:hypothetical protein